MFETVKFPARVSDLDPGLTDVNADDFSHFGIWIRLLRRRRKRRRRKKRGRRVRDLRFEKVCVSEYVFTNMTLKNGI